jgi:hypothetical protein
MPDPVHPRQQLGNRHGNARQGPAELDLARFDPSAEADLLLSRQEMDLADLLEVEPHRIFCRSRAGTKRFGRERWGFLENDGCDPLLVLQLDLRGLSLDLGQRTLSSPGLWLSGRNLLMDGLARVRIPCLPKRHVGNFSSLF